MPIDACPGETTSVDKRNSNDGNGQPVWRGNNHGRWAEQSRRMDDYTQGRTDGWTPLGESRSNTHQYRNSTVMHDVARTGLAGPAQQTGVPQASYYQNVAYPDRLQVQNDDQTGGGQYQAASHNQQTDFPTGYETGYRDGHQDGYETGFQRGYEAGLHAEHHQQTDSQEELSTTAAGGSSSREGGSKGDSKSGSSSKHHSSFSKHHHHSKHRSKDDKGGSGSGSKSRR
jgi:hypothetical protein